MAKRAAVDGALADLRKYTNQSYLQNTEVRQALAAQGVTLDSEEVRALPGIEELSTDADGRPTNTNADDADANVAELEASVASLGETDKARRDADKLRKTKPDTDAATKQALADKAQEVRGTAQQMSQDTQAAIRARLASLADRLGATPTPGSIGMLLVILALFVMLFRNVNGQPRFVWLWLVLTGHARLVPESEAGHAKHEGSTSGNTAATSSTGSGLVIDPSASGSDGHYTGPIVELGAYGRYLHE